ncbi:MAG: nuclear transport factor 2 family protein [Ignavibacteriae bacterium]|nr:nuclear transport factor 2 family protein [Ignavibacteriota bacterium]
MKTLPFLFLLIALTTDGFSQGKKDAEELSSVRSVLDEQVTAWNEGDLDGYMHGYWKSDSLLFTSGGNIQRGWKATNEKYKKSYDTKAKMGTLKFSNLEFNMLSKEAAWVFGSWELTREKDNPKGVFTLVMRKFDDGWKVVHDHTSSVQK